MNEIHDVARQAKKLYEDTDYVICAEHPVYGIFELGCWMCGFDDFLVRMAMDTEFVHTFFDIVLTYQKKVLDRYYGALGTFVHYTSSGDDFATQSSLFVSPEMFTSLIKPYFKERIRHTKALTGAAFLHHSCGSVFHIIGELIDSGVEILNPIQPKAQDMEPERIKRRYGEKIVFHGGIDTQEILPFGTKERIEEVVESTIRIMNTNGGYIFAAAHNIQEDVPPQNLVYMLEAARKYGNRTT
jgi:uroporphyrinogen decarboxylase